MSDFFLIGTLIALVIGVCHAVYLYGLVVNSAGSTPPESKISALNFSIWTCALWILTGAYLIGLWLIAVVFYLPFKGFSKS